MAAGHLSVAAGPVLSRAAPPLAVCTIVAKNHLPRARVLAESFRRYHSEIPFFVLLADEWNGEFELSGEPFQILRLRDLNIPDFDKFCFQYTLFELTCAVKPFLLEHLAANLGIRRLVYFDSDLLILGNLDPLFAQLDKNSILLTPHLTEPPAQDGKKPGEIDMLQVGIFNGGFVAVKYDATGRAFVNWWRERLFEQSRVDVEHGLFVDQKWLNLVPGLFARVGILREPGYNIAYWNLSTRKLELQQGAVCVNGQPGYFFHFSGFDLATPDVVSKHETRFTMETIGPAAALYRKYAERLAQAGDVEASAWQYAYGMFDNGVPVPVIARTLYTELEKKGVRFKEPFATQEASFFAWLNAPHEQDAASAQPISNLWYGIYRELPAIQAVFPDVFGADRQAYLQWVVDYGAHERGIPARFVAPALKTINLARYRSKSASSQARTSPKPFGVNLTGNFRSEKGVGEAVRSGRANLIAAQVPNVANDFPDILSLNRDMSVSDLTEQRPYRFNLIWLNADTIPLLLEQRGASFLDGYYNIGHWAWEVQDFPSQWATSFDPFSEIWVPSRFVQEGLARVSPVPVRAIPHSVSLPPDTVSTRGLVGLPPDKFVFLFMFDMSSFAARKNPRGLIRAFQKAFRRDDNVLLVLKCAHSSENKAELAEIQRAALESNILVTDAVLERAQIGALVDAADCYVSLHRAEGFGLTMAEAMARGKPVIATAYSGNMDYMNEANSFLVRYKMTAIGKTHGPYHKDYVWAEPDIEHAAAQMRHVFENRQEARAVGAAARRDILTHLHPRVVGELMKNYLSQVR